VNIPYKNHFVRVYAHATLIDIHIRLCIEIQQHSPERSA
jgi:hypothetical protein